jgi:hypothetical protein
MGTMGNKEDLWRVNKGREEAENGVEENPYIYCCFIVGIGLITCHAQGG